MSSNIFGAAGLFALATAFKLIIGVAIVKATAAVLGPEGYGYLGQLTTLVTIIIMIAGGGIHIGLTKFSSQLTDDAGAHLKYLIAALKIWIASSALIAASLVLFRNQLSNYLFGSLSYSWALIALALIQPLIGINNISQALVSGNRDIRGTALITIVSSCVSAALIIPLSIFYGLGGAMLATALSPGATIFITLTRLRKIDYIKNLSIDRFFSFGSSTNERNKLLKYTLMLLVSASTMPLALLFVRSSIADNIGWTSVGIWQGMTRLSDVYLQFVTVLLGQYYLPRLSNTKVVEELRREVGSMLRLALPFMVLICLCLYFARDLVIKLLFSSQFGAMQELFVWQLTGDVFKVGSYIMAYVTVAFALTKVYIIAEVLQAVLLIIFSSYLIPKVGVVGAVQAHCLTYIFYFSISLLTYFLVLKKGWLFR